MKKFLALLQKDWRVNRIPVVGLMLTVIAPFATLLPFAFESMQMQPARLSEYRQFLAGMAIFAIALTVLLAPIFGGNAFATERHERSADFLDTLPISRSLILFSKLA